MEYPLDLGISARTADAVGNEALVVSDPRSDLPNAKQEGEATAEALRSMGFRVLTSQGAAVSHSTLASGLPQAAFFHYAGHAVLQGVDGFSGGFPLKNGSSFNVGDILSLPQVPRIAVVFGCEGARTAGGPVETLGIAQAFVMRGSLVAVAPQRVVDDKASSRFATSFYAELAKARARQSASDGNSANSANSGNEWARLVGLAVTAAKQGHPDASAFRVVVP